MVCIHHSVVRASISTLLTNSAMLVVGGFAAEVCAGKHAAFVWRSWWGRHS